uniref:hypothetical protein n=1 Tax=Paractinoplanes polyasparticus TaxID=2856853 RepID=UPI001C85E6F4|nr:hypothetical protein [Actinoplanes polyasparticus]
MASWILVPCLVSLRGEFNALAPGRDRSTDGAIGDSNHTSSSDHTPDEQSTVLRDRDADRVNEVHAIDVDSDLRKPGWTMDRAVQIIVTRHRLGLDNRLQNVIWNRKIWSRSWGWTARAYSGASPHDHHAHFSARYDTASEQSTRPWGLLEQEEDVLNADDKKWIAAEIAKQVKTAVDGLAASLPTASEIAEAMWTRTRTDVRPPWSDTARNLFGAEITEAVKAGTAIERFPANQDK